MINVLKQIGMRDSNIPCHCPSFEDTTPPLKRRAIVINRSKNREIMCHVISYTVTLTPVAVVNMMTSEVSVKAIVVWISDNIKLSLSPFLQLS